MSEPRCRYLIEEINLSTPDLLPLFIICMNFDRFIP